MKARILLLAATMIAAGGAVAQDRPDPQAAPTQQASAPPGNAPAARHPHRAKAPAKPRQGRPTSEPTRPAKPSVPIAPAAH